MENYYYNIIICSVALKKQNMVEKAKIRKLFFLEISLENLEILLSRVQENFNRLESEIRKVIKMFLLVTEFKTPKSGKVLNIKFWVPEPSKYLKKYLF